MIGYIYFIRQLGNPSRYKIGFSVDVEKRMAAIQTSNPEPLELIGYVKGSMKLEKSAHASLRAWRVNGEWYDDCRAIRRFVNTCLSFGVLAAICEAHRKNVEREWKSDPIPNKKRKSYGYLRRERGCVKQ